MSVSQRPLAIATRNAAIAATLVGPLIYVGQLVTSSSTHLVEAVSGALLGAIFFASTAVVGLLSRNADLKSALLNAYLFKLSLLLVVYLAVPWSSVDRNTAALAVVGSSLVYLVVQSIWLTKRSSPG